MAEREDVEHDGVDHLHDGEHEERMYTDAQEMMNGNGNGDDENAEEMNSDAGNGDDEEMSGSSPSY